MRQMRESTSDPPRDDVIMGTMASQPPARTIFPSTAYPGVDQSTHQSSESLAFVLGIHLS